MRLRPLRALSDEELASAVRYTAIVLAAMAVGTLVWAVLIGPAVLSLMRAR